MFWFAHDLAIDLVQLSNVVRNTCDLYAFLFFEDQRLLNVDFEKGLTIDFESGFGFDPRVDLEISPVAELLGHMLEFLVLLELARSFFYNPALDSCLALYISINRF